MQRAACAAAAELVLGAHAGYLAFIYLGAALIIEGAILGWRWVRAPRWRAAHLAAVLIVCALQLSSTPCPFTTAENRLRACAGQPGYRVGFVSDWALRLARRPVSAAQTARAEAALAALTLLAFLAIPPGPARPRAA